RSGAPVRSVALHPPRYPHSCRHARSRNGRRDGRQRPHAALAQLCRRHLSRRALRRARRRTTRPRANHGNGPADAELHRHHRRRRRQPHRHPARRVADRRRFGGDRGLLPIRKRGDHVRDDGHRAPDPATRTARGRGHDDMSRSEGTLKLVILAAIWTALLLAPDWMPLLGGYTALGTRVLVLGLAAMSVNFLLGFTGVLSFGHAAYFTLGAYGAGFCLKILAPSTPLLL